jgi:ketosteroid isomerase-like protein
MSRKNVEVVRGVIDGWLRGDPATLELISDDVVYVSPPTMPDGRTYHGHEGVLQWVVDWGQEWTDYELDVLRYRDLGDRVVTVERNRATGKRSGVVVDASQRQGRSLAGIRDGGGGPRSRGGAGVIELGPAPFCLHAKIVLANIAAERHRSEPPAHRGM